MLNNYIFLDENNIVIDVFVFEDETSDDNVINHIKDLVSATDVVRSYNGFTAINSVKTVDYFGTANKGNVWDGIDTFLPPKPGENYILNYDRTSWVRIPGEQDE